MKSYLKLQIKGAYLLEIRMRNLGLVVLPPFPLLPSTQEVLTILRTV